MRLIKRVGPDRCAASGGNRKMTSKYKSYSKYKDSGIDCVGVIPGEWEVRKLKYLLKIPVTDGPHETPEFIDEGIPFLSVDSIQDGKLIFENCRHISKENHVRFKKKCNPMKWDIFLGKAASIGKIAIMNVGFEFSIWSPLALLRPNNKVISSRFMEYALKSDYSQTQIEIFATSNTQKNISMDDIPRIQIIVLPLRKQISIADFLDKKTAEIDELIEKDKKLIELLKEKRTALINHAVTKGLPVHRTQTGLDPNANMKDSGIEWIGKIPEEWKAKKLKQISEINISNVDKKSDEDESEVLLCNYIDVYKNEFIGLTINFMKATASVEQIRRFTIKMGDVIITKDSEEPTDIAIPALVIEDLKNVVCGYHLALIRSNKMILDGSFLFRALQSKKINDQFVIEANGVTRFGISTYPILNSYILIPPLSEQIQITEYLDKTTSKIDRTIEKIEAKIELLEEYKKSLIHHTVTGKIDVRGSGI
jgi:type I restriction enzyme, S subunit